MCVWDLSFMFIHVIIYLCLLLIFAKHKIPCWNPTWYITPVKGRAAWEVEGYVCWPLPNNPPPQFMTHDIEWMRLQQ